MPLVLCAVWDNLARSVIFTGFATLGNSIIRRMRCLDLTLDSPAENLALDETLLLAAEASVEGKIIANGAGSEVASDAAQTATDRELVRLWEPRDPLVVVGRSTNVGVEVNEAACRERNIPILRRSSGGAAIVAGPGCLMYAVILSYERRPHLRFIDQIHAFVLESLVQELSKQLPGVARQGISDLAWHGKKFSGNSVRCKREHVLYHGTLLYDFPLALVTELLNMPPRQPDYRAGRSHSDFLTNVPLSAATLRYVVRNAFDAHDDARKG